MNINQIIIIVVIIIIILILIISGYYMSTQQQTLITSSSNTPQNTQQTTITPSPRIYPPTEFPQNNTPSVSGQDYGNGYYIITASVERNGTGTAAYAFNYNTGFWQLNPLDGATAESIFSNNTYKGEYVQIQLPYSINIISYSIKTMNTNNPLEWVLGGSNDGSTWTLVDYQNLKSSLAYDTVFNYKATPGNYNYFRFVYLRSDGMFPVLRGLKFTGY